MLAEVIENITKKGESVPGVTIAFEEKRSIYWMGRSGWFFGVEFVNMYNTWYIESEVLSTV